MTDRPTVVFLHGLARSRRSLSRVRRAVEAAGYSTWARSYPSRHNPVASLAETIAGWIREDVGDRPVVAVTHSLGGIIVRQMREMLPWRGVVMIAPPNNGSRIAAKLAGNPVFRWFYGPVGQQLGELRDWPAPPEPFAIIAGTRSLALGNPTSWVTRTLKMLPAAEPSDGTVAVAETRLPGMADFFTVDASHTWIANHPQTSKLVLDFLERGSFT